LSKRISGKLSRGIFLCSQSELLLTFTSTHVALGSRLNSPSRQNGAAILEIEKILFYTTKGVVVISDTKKTKKRHFIGQILVAEVQCIAYMSIRLSAPITSFCMTLTY
jgi:hypothetical protein